MEVDTPLTHGPLKGEVVLANGSRIVFDAPVWKFSYHQSRYGSYDSILQAEERPQSSKDIIGIVEQGEKDLNVSLPSAVIKRNKEQRQLLEEARRLLSNNDIFLREYQIRVLSERIDESLQGHYGHNHSSDVDALWEIVKELADKDVSAPDRSRTGEYCVFCKSKGDYISNLRHSADCIVTKAYKLVWKKEESDRAAKKQEESTSLFDVISKAVLEHSGRTFNACGGDFTVTYLLISNRWNIGKNSYLLSEGMKKDELEAFAQRNELDLAKGWNIVNIGGIRG